ncbi:MAG: PAS domain S-box protein, partial [Planctomycetota bacterium]
DPIFWIAPDARIVYVNDAACRALGYSRKELLTMKVHDFDPQFPAESWPEHWEDLKTRHSLVLETYHRTKDGRTFPVEVAANYIRFGTNEYNCAFARDITQHKRAELALRLSEQRFRAIAEYTYFWEVWVSPKGQVLWTNPAVERITGYSPQELRSTRDYPLPLVCEQDREKMREVFQSALKGSSGREIEFRLRRKDGSVIWAEVSWQPIYDEKGLSQGHRSSVRDITERKHAAEALKLIVEGTASATGEDFFRSLVRALASAFDFRYAFVGEITGAKKDYIKTLAVWADDDFAANFEYELAGTPCQGVVGQKLCFHPKGVQKQFPQDHLLVELEVESYLGVPLFDSRARPLGLLAVMHDKTMQRTPRNEAILTIFASRAAAELEREAVSRALAASEKQFRSVAETATDAIISADHNGRIVFWNEAAERTFGYAANDIIGKPLTTIMPERYRHAHLRGLERFVKTGKSRLSGKVVELAGLRKNGSEFPVSLSIASWATEEGLFFTAIIRDITGRKAAEHKLREREQRYRELVETMNEGLGLADADYVFTYVNNRFAEMLGYSPQEMVGRHLTDFLDEDGKKAMAQQMQMRRKGQAKPYDLEWLAKDGRRVYTIASPKGIFDEQGNFKGSFGVLTDITDRKQAEQARDRLYQQLQAKNKELEALLYAASHDLRSPLVNIQGFSNELSRYCDLIHSALDAKIITENLDEKVTTALHSQIPEAIRFISTSADKMDSLLSGLLRLSRLGTAVMNVQTLDMNTVMANVLGSIEYQIKAAGAKVELQRLLPCLGDASQLNQVFSNLLDNALNYLDEARPGLIRIYASSEPGQTTYCVHDNGIGIDPQHQDKIFEIFHRLEPDKAKGEGLGLTIVRRILDRHNGKIWLQSEPGRGSCFFVALPSP